jgi:hypothetical protein
VKQRIVHSSIVALFLWIACPASADPLLFDFENLNDGDAVGGMLGSDVTFTNGVVLAASISLNELDFPPHSGTNVVADGGGPLRLDFSAPISSFAAYFTYTAPLTFQFFDGSSNLLGTLGSLFGDNTFSSGGATNEFFNGVFLGTSFLTITGNEFGGSFIMDDLSFDIADVAPVPEPGSLMLLGSGIAAAIAYSKTKKGRRRVTE